MIDVKFYGILNKTLGKRVYKSLDELKFYIKHNIYECKILKQKNKFIVVPLISGEGGGKGKGSPPTPLLKPPAPDENSLQSFSQSEVVDLICEGPIEGFCKPDGSLASGAEIAKGIYFNGTVVQNENGSYNYRKLALNWSPGNHKGIDLNRDTWSRSKIYNTQSIKQSLVGPNMGTAEDGASILYGGGTPNFKSMLNLMKQEGQTAVKSDFNTANWFSKNGSYIGYFLGTSAGLDEAIKYGYAASEVQHGSDIRTHTSTRNFTSWSAGHAEFSDGAFPVSHTITNPEVDFAYITMSVDDLKDTVDHGSGGGKVGLMTTAREHKVGFQVEIGINGLSDQEANSLEFTQWLAHHGISQVGSAPRKSITRNYFVQGLVQGSNYLIDVGRASFGDSGEIGFGEDNDFDLGTKDLETGGDPAGVFDAEALEGVTPDQAIPHTFAPSSDEAALGLNRFRQFGQDSGMRQYYEEGLETFFMPITDANNSFNCFKMPPAIAGKTRYIKVTKTGREIISPIMSAKITLESVTEIIDEKMSYPYSAIIQQSFNSRYFRTKPDRSYHLRLKKILIPSNYTPDNRYVGGNVYDGNWDGTFKYEWSDNPAWVLYDLMINNRYGIGAYLDIDKIDKWTLYKIGRYCDAVNDSGAFVGVDDTYNGKEPRYTMNVIISEEEEAYQLLKTIAETFHGIAYWDGRGVSVSLDGGSNTVSYVSFSGGASYSIGDVVEFPASTFNFFKKTATGGTGIRPGVDNNWQKYWNKVPGVQVDEPSINFSNTNVEGGAFSYYTSSKSTRYTVARVGYMDKKDNFRKKYEYVEDKQGVKELGVIRKNIEPLGCTSRGQARRMGRWFFLTSSVNTETITFSTDYRALFLKPGNIISVTDTLKNTNQSIGKVIDVEGDETLVLTQPISLKAYDPTSRQSNYFDIILGNIDPSYDVDFLDNKSSVSSQDIKDLNKSQRIKGSVFPADGGSPVTNKIKVKDINGNFIKFTTSILDSYNNSYKVILRGTDWALINPEDGGQYGTDWRERKYRIQAIEEEGEGKYRIVGVFFDEEKLSSMDQTFPIITSDYDISVGTSQVSANITPPIVEKFKAKSSYTLTFDVKFTTTVDESLFNNVTNNIILISPSGDQTTHNSSSRNGGGSKVFSITTSVVKASSAATGTWSLLVTTSGTEKSSGKSKTSASGILSAILSDSTYSSGPPVVSDFTIDGGVGNYIKITTNSPSYNLIWKYRDVDGFTTTYTSSSILNSSSPYFEGFKIGLCPVDRTGASSARNSGVPLTNQTQWIYDENNLYKRLEYNFQYNTRFETVVDDQGNVSFKYSNLQDQRGIAVVIQAIAKAGGQRRYSSIQTFQFYDAPTIFTGVMTSILPEWIPSEKVFLDLNQDQKIKIITTDDNGDDVHTETAAHGDIPDEARFDYQAEMALNSSIPNRIYSIDDALAYWDAIKNLTIQSLKTNVYHNSRYPYLTYSFDQIKQIAETWEDYGSNGFKKYYKSLTVTHFENFSAVNYWKQESVEDSAMLEELGSWTTSDVEFNDTNKAALQKNRPDGAGANTLMAFDSLDLNISGSYHNPAIINANRYSTKQTVGHCVIYANKNNPSFDLSETLIIQQKDESTKITIPYDAELENGGINYDRDYYFKVKVFESFVWNNSLLSEIDKANILDNTVFDFGVTGFMIAPQDELADLSEEIEDEEGSVEELGHVFMNTFGDERVVGMKQFREGLIIGGTKTWSTSEGAQSDPDSFIKYPLASKTAYQGTPVGIGQFDVESLSNKTFTDLLGEGDSSNSFALTSGSIDNDMLDFFVNVKGMNIRCLPGDDGNYNGQGGIISGSTIKTNGFEAGEIVNFTQEPTIGNSPMSTYFSEGEGLSGKIDQALNNTTIFDNKIQDTGFTQNLVISGDSRLKVEDGNLHIEVNGIWYKIIPDGIS